VAASGEMERPARRRYWEEAGWGEDEGLVSIADAAVASILRDGLAGGAGGSEEGGGWSRGFWVFSSASTGGLKTSFSASNTGGSSFCSLGGGVGAFDEGLMTLASLWASVPLLRRLVPPPKVGPVAETGVEREVEAGEKAIDWPEMEGAANLASSVRRSASRVLVS
jgi:hypothetical protein